jgi:hypothetical protein
VTTREPLYTEQDRGELLAYQLYLESLCPRCGRPLDVCTSDERANPRAAQFDVVWQTCRASLALLERQRATYGDKEHPNRPAHLWGTTIRKR